MKTSTRIRATCAIAMAAGLALSACDASSGSGAGAHVQKMSSQTQLHNPAARPPDDMVAAVSAGKSGPPVQLKFELRSAPQADQPVNVEIAVLPDAPAISRLYGKFNTEEGLELVVGGELEAVDKPANGSVIRHVLQIVPHREGIFTLSATVAVELANDSVTRTFSIPVIVGAGLAELKAKAEVAGEPGSPGTGSKTH